ncbi:MAG: Asp-tRNA(Asn)/Glu-tRNA(Gln) amidotransferase subunit GatC [Candidatus Korobacteraceae bacterium]
MKVTDKDVRYVAELANLALTEAEVPHMVKDLSSTLDYIDCLNELDTSSIEPMAQVSDRYGADPSKSGTERFAYAMREDEPRPSLSREEVMKLAPESDGTFFKVPKVIER